MKRILAAAVLALTAAAALFADNADYEALFAKAQAYEKAEKYVHALGTYWDAMDAAPEKAMDAFNAYTKLAGIIQGGKPGKDIEYDEFDMYDGWVALCKDFEQYWTETCPNIFTFSIRKGELDMKTRTATYYVNISVDENYRYTNISYFILMGLKKHWNTDWVDIPQNWPLYSVYKDESTSMKKDGIALFKPISQPAMPAALWSLRGKNDRYNKKDSLYDVKFNITDENGTVLLTSARKRMGSEGAYEFKGVPQATMKIIDAGKARIVPAGIWLEYGKCTSNYSNQNRDWLKSLPELEMDAKKVTFNLPGKPLQDEELAASFDGGVCLVFRLCVDNYHRYSYADSGKKGRNVFIPGVLHTVRPVALESLPVFSENCREYTVIESECFGKIVQMEVGAMLVGRIVNAEGEGTAVRGKEKGFFEYGGSTIILLVGAGKLSLRSDIADNSRMGCETPVQMGECIAVAAPCED